MEIGGNKGLIVKSKSHEKDAPGEKSESKKDRYFVFMKFAVATLPQKGKFWKIFQPV